MSTSASPNKTFYRAFGLVVGCLSVGILVLALLVTTSGPRVRYVAAQNQSGDGISGVDQGLTVVFDRPVEKTDFESAIEFEPEVDYAVSHRDQQLSITFDQNLLLNTRYALTIRPELEDDLGRGMEREYNYEFTTEEPSFTYLERNYGRGTLDRIVEKAPLSEESYVLFGGDRIKSFARNKDYLAVVLLRSDNTDELRVVDLTTRDVRVVDMPANAQVDNLRFSPTDNQLVFVARVLGEVSEPDGQAPSDSSGLYRYAVAGEQLEPVNTSSDKGGVESASYSRDGQALLYRTIDKAYYLTGAAQTTETSPIGIYGDSGGFNRTNTKLVFQVAGSAKSRGGLAIYDAQAKETQELPGIGVGGSSSPPTFLHNSDELAYLWDPYNTTEGEAMQVRLVSADGEEQAVMSSEPSERFFGELAISHDDRYVLVEATATKRGAGDLDDYPGNRQPKDAWLVLYDRFEDKVIDSGTRGIDPVWNR